MKIKNIKSVIAIILVLCMTAGCAASGGDSSISGDGSAEDHMQLPADEEFGADSADNKDTGDKVSEESLSNKYERPALIVKELRKPEEKVVANVPVFEVKPDLSNVYRIDDYWFQDAEREKLYNNGFVVGEYGYDEFFEIYEMNRYDYKASFITVDSLMHTYHLYFSQLLKGVEKKELSDALTELSKLMVKNSTSQYEKLSGDSDWEEAAKCNVAFFTVGTKLLDEKFEAEDYVKDIVDEELSEINDASEIEISSITGFEEDYTQYKPRGYYDGDEQLEKYFRAMMWYGRIHFKQESEDLDRSALLITKALMDDEEAYRLWSSIYAVTSFFAGASDDVGAAEYAGVMDEAYAQNPSYDELIENKDAFQKFHELTKDVKVPQINSIPIWDGENNIIPGFRFMGQRFTIDASVMQKLIYSAVKENKDGEYRMLPDVLDFPAALGSETALEILKDKGETDYEGYMDNMNKIKDNLSDDESDIWFASLYSSWLHTLRPLLNEDRTGYPQFMRSKEWLKKNLECFAGSFTELKHDTVLYSKQILAEMGGGEIEEYDDRGYVEPEPLVYSRFVYLAEQTRDGLKRFDMLDKEAEDDLNKLIEIAENLKTISEKELRDELPTDEEFDFIREYGGYIEHFWLTVAREATGLESVSTQEYPCPIVTDIATDPNGTVLELATGTTSNIMVLVKVDDKVKIAWGSVYSFYQFPWPMDDRLTDKQWWQMLGIDWDPDNYNWEETQNNIPEKPDWTESYRYKYVYE